MYRMIMVYSRNVWIKIYVNRDVERVGRVCWKCEDMKVRWYHIIPKICEIERWKGGKERRWVWEERCDDFQIKIGCVYYRMRYFVDYTSGERVWVKNIE